MENNELEEMREQLATLNEKIEKEPIVNDAMIENAVKERLNWLQKKSMRMIIIFAILTPLMGYFVGLLICFMCLECLMVFAYICANSKKMNDMTYNVAEYTCRTKKMVRAVGGLKRVFLITGGICLVLLYLVVFLNYIYSESGHFNVVGCVGELVISTLVMIVLFSIFYACIQFFLPEIKIKLEFMLKDLENIEKEL